MDTLPILRVKQVTSANLCVRQGTLLSALWGLNGKQPRREGICIADSLCCSAETNTAL